jgi:hypothetical protein
LKALDQQAQAHLDADSEAGRKDAELRRQIEQEYHATIVGIEQVLNDAKAMEASAEAESHLVLRQIQERQGGKESDSPKEPS